MCSCVYSLDSCSCPADLLIEAFGQVCNTDNFACYFWVGRSEVVMSVCIIGRGRGKRRFAPQGVWRSGGAGPDVEPVVWLPGAPKSFPRPPLPPPTQEVSSGGKPRKKDEYHLVEVRLARG